MAASRRAASSASRASACASARTSASCARSPSISTAHGGELRLDVGRRRQRRQRLLGVAAAAGGFVAARGQARPGLAQRREPRRVAARLALGVRVLVARGVGLVLQFAPAVAGGGLGLGRGGHLGLGLGSRLLLGLDLAAHRLQLGLDVGEPVLAGEPAGGAGRRIGGDREAVPAPQIAVARDQALAGLEQLDQRARRPRARSRRSAPAAAPAPWAPSRGCRAARRPPAMPDRSGRSRRRPSASERTDRPALRDRRRARRRARPRSPSRP